MRGSPRHCLDIALTADGTSHSLVPGGSCHTRRKPAGPASPPESPATYSGPALSASRDVPGQASTLHPGSQTLAAIQHTN